jgi:hypothetical protein
MSEHKHIDPTPETLANRRAGMEMMDELAMRGDRIALMTHDLMRIAQPFYINEAVNYADDDDGWDDVRPF